MGKSSNRPVENNARKPVSTRREIYKEEKKVCVDPRFSALSGHLNDDLYQKSYEFLDDIKKQEEKQLRSQAKRLRTAKKPHALEEKSEVKEKLLQYKYERTNRAQRETEQKVKREWRKQESAKVSAGKKPFFLKRSTQREAELKDKFQKLKKDGKLDAFLQKQRKKQALADAAVAPQLSTFAPRKAK